MRALPSLAGVCTHEEGAKLGYNVQESVALLLRYAWINKRVMDMGLYWINPTPEWEMKEALSLHVYLAADHAAMMRNRISEMRNPAPKMNVPPNVVLDAFLDELLWAEDTLEKVIGVYGVLKPALLEAYREHYERANPLVDYPTRRILRTMIAEEEDAVAWGQAAIEAVAQTDDERLRSDIWHSHIEAYLNAAGGVNGLEEVSDAPLPESRVKGEFKPDYMPQRDERFTLRENFVTAAHQVAGDPDMPIDEQTLGMMVIRTGEMNVPEAMAYMIAEQPGQPWDFFVDMTRQLWDECRHAMMGTVYFEQNGIDWKKDLALDPGFSIRLNLYMTPVEAHAVLYAIEQSFMRATFGGKKSEWERATEANDDLAKLYQDYDWADEVLHVYIGRKWCVGTSELSRKELMEMAQKRFTETESLLNQNHINPEKQTNWWAALVRKALDKETEASEDILELDHPMASKEGYITY
jgi:hypothetical protein